MKLAWEERYGCFRAPAPLFGHIRVEDYGSGEWMVNYSVPGLSDNLLDNKWPTPEKAKFAAEAYIEMELRDFLEAHKDEGLTDG